MNFIMSTFAVIDKYTFLTTHSPKTIFVILFQCVECQVVLWYDVIKGGNTTVV